MPQKAITSHRGEKYEIGRGKRFYGIWVVGAPYEAPVDRWPESRDGWEQAWTRFVELETPATIRPVDQRRARPRLRRDEAAAAGAAGTGAKGAGASPDAAPGGVTPAARRRLTALVAGEGLLVLGVVLGLVGLFPGYASGQSLLSQGYQVVPHLLYVVTWAVGAGLIALGVARPGMARLGAMLALGLSAVTFGLFLADTGEVISGGATLGTGLVLSLIGWFLCTVGAACALRAACHDDAHTAGTVPPRQWAERQWAEPQWAEPQWAEPQWDARQWDAQRPSGAARPRLGLTRPTRGHAGPLALLVLAAIGTVAAFAPSWDSYTLAVSSTGTTQTITEGNAFSSPGVVIAGNVAVMVAVIVVAALAALWRPARQGAMMLAGAIVPLVAQAIAALIQVDQPTASTMFGISRAAASAAGLTISSGVTSIFWVYCVFVIALLISCAWLFTTPEHPAHPAMPAMPGRASGPWPPITGPDPVPGTTGDEPVSERPDTSGEPRGEAADRTDAQGGSDHSAYA